MPLTTDEPPRPLPRTCGRGSCAADRSRLEPRPLELRARGLVERTPAVHAAHLRGPAAERQSRPGLEQQHLAWPGPRSAAPAMTQPALPPPTTSQSVSIDEAITHPPSSVSSRSAFELKLPQIKAIAQARLPRQGTSTARPRTRPASSSSSARAAVVERRSASRVRRTRAGFGERQRPHEVVARAAERVHDRDLAVGRAPGAHLRGDRQPAAAAAGHDDGAAAARSRARPGRGSPASRRSRRRRRPVPAVGREHPLDGSSPARHAVVRPRAPREVEPRRDRRRRR